MFKAFTKNISSFMGVGEGKAEEEGQASENTTAANDDQSTRDDQTSKPTEENGIEKIESEKKGSKVPPPRPAPPLTPASSVCKPDTPPGTPKHGEDADNDIKIDNDHVAESENMEAGESGKFDADGKKDKVDERLEEVAEKAKQWGSMYCWLLTVCIASWLFGDIHSVRDGLICEVPVVA